MSVRKSVLLILAVLVAVVGFAAFGAGFYFGKSQIPPSSPPAGIINTEPGEATGTDFSILPGEPKGVDFSIFWETWNVLEKNFVDKSKIDYQKMIYGAVKGMVNSLGDPYTIFMTPEDAKIFEEDVSGEFQGVGMEIGIKQSQLQVVAPLKGTPAEKAGLLAGDKIIKIDEKDTQGMSIDEAVKLIRGPKGTQVTLTIFREGWSKTKDFTIVRDVIEVPSLDWQMKDSDIAYIRLYQFSSKANSDFAKTAVEILNSPAQKIILDLRNNPGGYLEVAQSIAGWFLNKGEVVTIEDYGGGKESQVYKSEGPAKLLSYPLVILINQGSASGSEILAGALRDDRGIKLIGETSFGKGSVQELQELTKGSLKVTIAKWLTPKGESISDKGLEPDIEVKMTEEDINAGKDPQLDKAIEIVNEMQ